MHERALRIVYKDEPSDNLSFQNLLDKDGAVKIHDRNLQRHSMKCRKEKIISPLPMQEFLNKQAQVYNLRNNRK